MIIKTIIKKIQPEVFRYMTLKENMWQTMEINNGKQVNFHNWQMT